METDPDQFWKPPNESRRLVQAIQEGDLEGVQECLQSDPSLLTATHDCLSFNGSVVHCAVLYNQHHLVAYFMDEWAKVHSSVREVDHQIEATFFALKNLKYSLVLLLLSKSCDPNQQRKADGCTLLHLCCHRRKPPVLFIKQLLKVSGLEVDLTNTAGYTPLHLLCLKAEGPEGKEVVRLLKLRGAALEAPAPDGRIARQLTQNAYIRSALSLSAVGKREFPALNQKEPPTPAKETTAISNDAGTRRGGKLNAAAMRKLNDRLFTSAMSHQANKTAQLQAKYLPEVKRVVMSEAEMEDFASRHFYEMLDWQEERQEELEEKYIQELVVPTQLAEEDLVCSVQRLYTEGVEHLKEVQSALSQKYLTPPPVRKQTKAQAEQSVQNLYYKGIEHMKAKNADLAHKYMTPPTRRKLTIHDLKGMTDRLYKHV
eukprot:NODE_1759_length_1390_cov_63.869359_g1670_i0.p1 GENE.NODE_1759_length_1390_cov_63.869359_g1670_i0~~NODE_1759_length_1390_cov_63.869359_g1670_i0.p1  ORF type:complete len:428 (-),score=128.52 NODE_1759_length_1390_cov_63.869359_g1670_i0:23-1306(-)